MNTMLRKNLRLVNFPITWLFIGLVALLYVPEYPYFMTFLYQVLALYFVFQGVRENHDVDFSLMLPIRKREIAIGYIQLACLVEIVQVISCVPVIFTRYRINPALNPVGIEANIALMGLAFAMFGIYNLIFFPMFLKNASSLAIPSIVASTVAALLAVVIEVAAHLGGPIGAVLNAIEIQHLGGQLAILGGGIAVFVLANIASVRLSVARFERADF